MTLFSAPDEPQSHRTRIVLAEKSVDIEVIQVVPGRYPEDLLDLNPYHSVPTLVDRDLVLYDSRVIIEYLDERFPHPPLPRQRPRNPLINDPDYPCLGFSAPARVASSPRSRICRRHQQRGRN